MDVETSMCNYVRGVLRNPTIRVCFKHTSDHTFVGEVDMYLSFTVRVVKDL